VTAEDHVCVVPEVEKIMKPSTTLFGYVHLKRQGASLKIRTYSLQAVSAAQNQRFKAKFSRHFKDKSRAGIRKFESGRPSQRLNH
jgi:hypothetical protein